MKKAEVVAELDRYLNNMSGIFSLMDLPPDSYGNLQGTVPELKKGLTWLKKVVSSKEWGDLIEFLTYCPITQLKYLKDTGKEDLREYRQGMKLVGRVHHLIMSSSRATIFKGETNGKGRPKGTTNRSRSTNTSARTNSGPSITDGGATEGKGTC